MVIAVRDAVVVVVGVTGVAETVSVRVGLVRVELSGAVVLAILHGIAISVVIVSVHCDSVFVLVAGTLRYVHSRAAVILVTVAVVIGVVRAIRATFASSDRRATVVHYAISRVVLFVVDVVGALAEEVGIY